MNWSIQDKVFVLTVLDVLFHCILLFHRLCSINSSNSFSTKYRNKEDTQISSNNIIISYDDIECDRESTNNYHTSGQDGQGRQHGQDGQEESEKKEGNNLFFKYLG